MVIIKDSSEKTKSSAVGLYFDSLIPISSDMKTKIKIAVFFLNQ